MFGDLTTCTGYDKAGQGADVERVLTIATCAYDIEDIVSIQVDGDTEL